MQQKISIKSIAKLVGTSVTTVSFVINGKAKEKGISEAMTAKIMAVVEEHNYKPSSLATSFRTGKSKIIGFLVDDISEPFFSRIARLIDEKANSQGYKILFSSTGSDKQKASSLFQSLRERHVDGYIIALAEGIEDEVSQLIATGAPVVLFDRYLPDVAADYVLTDNFRATKEATQHLITNGYKKIGFITVDSDQQQMLDRLKGYKTAIAANELKDSVLKIKYTSSEDSIEQIDEFLQANKDLDGLIFAANYITLDGLRLSRKQDDSIVKNKAIISFDDFELLEFVNPAITAIAQSLEEIAENIVKILLAKLNTDQNSNEVSHSILKVAAKLNIRQSTAKVTN